MSIRKWLISIIVLMLVVRPGFGCTCGAISPAQGFEQAEAVFTGSVIRSRKSQWRIKVERVWKGDVESEVIVFDAYAGSSCSTSGYKRGTNYLFLVNVESARGLTRYSPQVCNWGTQLKFSMVSFLDEGPAKFIEDWVLEGRGEGRSPNRRTP